ncbi:hypothetical protein EMIHUDRAFT_100944 [Emiliania huxleyi CCMP1516]|uniref:Fatty acid desaturase domain-containing protein n=2 Tax=Emiliania huxleyi TaxID=2903 RepID=A0A0D3JP07_EMIH1|nr:hypothetical protein EMIHUDRAFT_100944 [Emiliania huxleyi CCMP1516]EOD25242.1 hypothetical protein EMIHUDRAFT_100944 [Emiliania huxleyi CCMP1516]|eukprot:XP_005777671.1 hypothetical protein EMIHUDRAFT_100944 [Emiliania huxleyi CCMP1516]
MSKSCPSISDIRSWLPTESFEKSTAHSLAYFGRDALGFSVGVAIIVAVCESDWFHVLPSSVQAAALLPLQIVTGFFMWCLFVVGHDCGHTTFSQHELINEVFGEICHSDGTASLVCIALAAAAVAVIATANDDASPPSGAAAIAPTALAIVLARCSVPFAGTRFAGPTAVAVLCVLLQRKYLWQTWHYILRPIAPLYTWPFYLFAGIPDGGHLLLFGRAWGDASATALARGYLSAALTVASMYSWHLALGGCLVRAYCMPWLWYGWWLFTVTYLQHHHADVALYDASSWGYVRGAFQTMDRTFGCGIDALHHNITDGHVVHHLFFTQIPHFRLSAATTALRDALERRGYNGLYKHTHTPRFAIGIFAALTSKWFFVEDRHFVSRGAMERSE